MPPDFETTIRLHAPPSRVCLASPDTPVIPAADGAEMKAPPIVSAPSAVLIEQGRPAPVAEPVASTTEISQVARAVESSREAENERRRQEETRAIQEVLQALTSATRRIEAEHAARIADLRRNAIELAVTIATRLVRDRVEANEFAVEEIVREAAAILGTRGPLVVRLHPDDLALLETRLNGASLFDDGAGIVMTIDSALGRGGCRVEGHGATVTARLSEQLATMRRELLRSLDDAEAES